MLEGASREPQPQRRRHVLPPRARAGQNVRMWSESWRRRFALLAVSSLLSLSSGCCATGGSVSGAEAPRDLRPEIAEWMPTWEVEGETQRVPTEQMTEILRSLDDWTRYGQRQR